MFEPRLILGIPDGISRTGLIDRAEAISEIVDDLCGHAEYEVQQAEDLMASATAVA